MRLISVKEYAKIKKIPRLATVYAHIRKGLIPSVPFERTVLRIPWDDKKQTVVKKVKGN